MNWQGLAIGACTFLIIGIFHPLVIKGEYYLGLKVNYIFALLGVVASIAALMTEGVFLSAVFAVIAFSSFWSIWEVLSRKSACAKDGFLQTPNVQATLKIAFLIQRYAKSPTSHAEDFIIRMIKLFNNSPFQENQVRNLCLYL